MKVYAKIEQFWRKYNQRIGCFCVIPYVKGPYPCVFTRCNCRDNGLRERLRRQLHRVDTQRLVA